MGKWVGGCEPLGLLFRGRPRYSCGPHPGAHRRSDPPSPHARCTSPLPGELAAAAALQGSHTTFRGARGRGRVQRGPSGGPHAPREAPPALRVPRSAIHFTLAPFGTFAPPAAPPRLSSRRARCSPPGLTAGPGPARAPVNARTSFCLGS